MNYFWAGTGLAGIALQIMVVSAMLSGPWREYRVQFVYMIVLLATTSVEASAFFGVPFAASSVDYYWVFDSIRQTLLFLVVVSLIRDSSDDSPLSQTVQRWMAFFSVVFIAGSVYLTHSNVFDRWMTRISRNLGFLAVVLNLILWAALLAKKRRNTDLLMISGGMGIQMAGKAIGHSFRQISRSTILFGNLIIVLSHLFCLYIWWQAFRRAAVTSRGATGRSG
jgi:hypothetical protein